MLSIRYFIERKLLTFILATLVVQLSVLAVGFYLKLTTNELELRSSNEYSSNINTSKSLLLKSNTVKSNNVDGTEQPAPALEEYNSIKTVTHQVRSGETLSRLWSQYSSDATGGIYAFEALKEAGVGVSAIKAGMHVELKVANQDITEFKLELSNANEVLLQGSSSEGYTATVIEPEIVEEERTISGVITSSFAAAAKENNIPWQVVDQLVDLFGARIEFRRDVQVGDSFSIMYTEKRLPDGRIIDIGQIKGASFQNKGRWLATVSHLDKDGKIVFYDEQGRAAGEFFLRYPVQFSRISSVFSHARFHPVLKRVRPHNGVDFAAPTGTPVRSVGEGIVVDAGYRGGAGNMVKIKHNDKYSTAYMHLHNIARGLKKGQKVARGEVIGTVGMTGTATGPHLHYSLYIHGKYVDPMKAELPQIPNSKEVIPQDYFDDVILALKSSEENLKLALNQSAGEERAS